MDGDIAISEQQTIHEKAPEVEFVFSEKIRSTDIYIKNMAISFQGSSIHFTLLSIF